MYTLKEAAMSLKIPDSAIRQYTRDFADYLSKSARQRGTSRLYSRNDLVILGRIRKYKSERKSKAEITSLLKKPAGNSGSLFDRITSPDRKRK